ncbi:putative membrane protein [Rhizobium herbae]|uniref:Membrane protein n=1 Tax=Rhizobium herbae TaxID=508661 RepID=A0ABS4EW21_9HYPH|nr:putative membrane protein [Rhizobium herbae]
MEPLIGLNQKALAGETSGDQLGPPLPTTSSEKVNAVIHCYRGEMGRMTGW